MGEVDYAADGASKRCTAAPGGRWNDVNHGMADGWEDWVRTASTSSDPEVVRGLVREE